MNLVAWVVLGLLAGAIANAMYPGHQGGGILSIMLLGIIGAFIGSSLGVFLSTGTLALAVRDLNLPGDAVAIIGTPIAIFLGYAFTSRTVL